MKCRVMTMKIRTEVYWESLNKFGEELCGDKVEVVQTPEQTILVMADGLGSGVKANILSTLTTKIAITMLKEGSSVEETVQTIISTLPVCKVRKIAYSTFTIIKVDNMGNCYIVEYDNPTIFVLREGRIKKLKGSQIQMAGKQVNEFRFTVEENDILIAVSDGVVHAGVGGLLNLGWQWENIAKYIEKVSDKESTLKNLVKLLTTVTSNFYMDKPGDDATVAAVKVIRPRHVTVFTGPPQNPADDEKVVGELMQGAGKRVVCGGTAANIVARVLDRELVTSIKFLDPKIPPTAKIKGIDLVTEGVLTLARARDILSRYMSPNASYYELRKLNKKDGASRLASILAESTDIDFLLGKAINPAHQNPEFPDALSIKLNVAEDIIKLLKRMGKNVKVKYY